MDVMAVLVSTLSESLLPTMMAELVFTLSTFLLPMMMDMMDALVLTRLILLSLR